MGKKTVLVSGGAGFIGSHVTVELINAGYDVVVADNMSNCDMTCFEGVKKITGRDDIPFEKIDCCDAAAVDGLFGRYRIDAVIHFAAYKAVGESVAEPIKYYRNNLDSFLNILDASVRHGGCNVLFSSSATVYGETDKLPVTEESPRQPAISPYGNTKQICEDILRDVVKASAAYGDKVESGRTENGPVKGIALRYFNPIGAHPSGLMGEDPAGIPNNLMPYITQVAVGRLEQLSVFGDDYDTVDGSGVRDYVHVMDLASGHVAALKALKEGGGVSVYNLGTGQGTSVLELVAAFERATGAKVPCRIAPRRAGDVAACYADCSKAAAELGWKARYSIDDMCADSWRWQQMNPKGYEG